MKHPSFTKPSSLARKTGSSRSSEAPGAVRCYLLCNTSFLREKVKEAWSLGRPRHTRKQNHLIRSKLLQGVSGLHGQRGWRVSRWSLHQSLSSSHSARPNQEGSYQPLSLTWTPSLLRTGALALPPFLAFLFGLGFWLRLWGRCAPIRNLLV